jgi:acetyltransferase-like isoleucine patch superfamily enzyme
MKMFKVLNNWIFNLKLKSSDGYKKAELYKRHLKINMGNNVRITGKVSFGSEPYLIKIGDNVTITPNVMFITHDGGVAVFRDEYPGLNVYGKIEIGSNVFIGAGAIILPDVVIGDNVVIGAGSLVNKNVPANVVVAGVPAKVIRTLDEYKQLSLKKGLIVDDNNRESKIKEYLAETK